MKKYLAVFLLALTTIGFSANSFASSTTITIDNQIKKMGNVDGYIILRLTDHNVTIGNFYLERSVDYTMWINGEAVGSIAYYMHCANDLEQCAFHDVEHGALLCTRPLFGGDILTLTGQMRQVSHDKVRVENLACSITRN